MTYDTANRLIGFGTNLPHNIRPDGLRAFKQGVNGPKYFVYDRDTVILEFEPANRTFRAYAYGANGLAMSLGDSGIYTVYAYDPFGRRINRIDSNDFPHYLGQAVAWYDAYGGVAFDFSPRSGGAYARDSVGYLGQWGYYTDVETAPTNSLTGLLYVDASYYDPARGLKLNRSSGGSNPYAGLRLQGDTLAHLCWNTVVATAEAGYLSADPSAPQGLAFLKMLEASAGVVQIAATIEGYASLPLALGGLGAGILNAADDLAGAGARLAGRAGSESIEPAVKLPVRRYTLSPHALTRMEERHVTEAMINLALRRGELLWDPKERSTIFLIRNASFGWSENRGLYGRHLMVAVHPFKRIVKTVEFGSGVIRKRWVPINQSPFWWWQR